MSQNFGLGFVVNTEEKEKSGNPFTTIRMWQSNSLFFSLFSFTVEKEKSGSPFTAIPMWQSNSLFFSLFSFISTETVRLSSSENFLSFGSRE